MEDDIDLGGPEDYLCTILPPLEPRLGPHFEVIIAAVEFANLPAKVLPDVLEVRFDAQLPTPKLELMISQLVGDATPDAFKPFLRVI